MIKTDSEVDGREAVAVLKETEAIDVPEDLKVATSKDEGVEVDESNCILICAKTQTFLLTLN